MWHKQNLSQVERYLYILGAVPLKCANQIKLMQNQEQELNLKSAPQMCTSYWKVTHFLVENFVMVQLY